MFRENNIDFEKVNYFAEPLSDSKLRNLLKKLQMGPFEVLRKGEASAKERGLTAETPGEEVIAAILADPSLLQRPIVEVGNRAVIARPIEKALPLIK